MTDAHTGKADVGAIEARADAAWNAQPEAALIAEIRRLEAREKLLTEVLQTVDAWASDKSKFNERSVIAGVRTALSTGGE